MSFIKFQNGNAELMILRLVPHVCFLLLGCQEAYGSDVPPGFLLFFNICFLLFTF